MVVFICIVVSALANVQARLFPQELIDDYIVPMIGAAAADFCPAGRSAAAGGAVYASAFCAVALHPHDGQRLAGHLRNLRTKLFSHMESLPISLF